MAVSVCVASSEVQRTRFHQSHFSGTDHVSVSSHEPQRVTLNTNRGFQTENKPSVETHAKISQTSSHQVNIYGTEAVNSCDTPEQWEHFLSASISEMNGITSNESQDKPRQTLASGTDAISIETQKSKLFEIPRTVTTIPSEVLRENSQNFTSEVEAASNRKQDIMNPLCFKKSVSEANHTPPVAILPKINLPNHENYKNAPTNFQCGQTLLNNIYMTEKSTSYSSEIYYQYSPSSGQPQSSPGLPPLYSPSMRSSDSPCSSNCSLSPPPLASSAWHFGPCEDTHPALSDPLYATGKYSKFLDGTGELDADTHTTLADPLYYFSKTPRLLKENSPGNMNIGSPGKSMCAKLNIYGNGNCTSGATCRRQSAKTTSRDVLKKRRLAANARERRRMTGLNEAFDRLRDVVPALTGDQKLSKFETLQMAQTYINALLDLLH
ncbi:Myc-type basic helix-loop-helix (bHLH) domain [Trinorchestia longiramus]|nr:Myc-type basic helix-loop-helix (bHLH) domain [Trinorchestia longiramus]